MMVSNLENECFIKKILVNYIEVLEESIKLSVSHPGACMF